MLPTDLLGSRKVPADTSAVAEWLLEAADRSPLGAVVSLDTLAWGGLIPSRQSGADLPTALERLAVLRRLKASHPRLKVLAFSSIQRVSRDDDAAEEPDYYREHGRAIFRRSVLEHRAAEQALQEGEEAELERLRREVPASVWDDQLAIRQRTAAINFAALDLVEDGVLDALVLNQDDTTAWGINVMHRRRLEREVARRRLGGRVLVYPGADEVAQALLARLASEVLGRRPRVSTFWSARRGAEVVTGYEDRPLGDLVSVHLATAGAVQVPSGAGPQLWLGVNAPSRAQGQGGVTYALANSAGLSPEKLEWLEASEAPVNGLDRSLGAFRGTLGALLDGGARVSLADLAHVNGADDELMSGVAADGALPRLAGYGGWNTAGNALGSAVALGCLAALGADGPGLELAVAARITDDWLYQARVRTQLLMRPDLEQYGLGGFLQGAQLTAVEATARELLNHELRAHALPYEVTRLRFPWRRVFEIDYDLRRLGGRA